MFASLTFVLSLTAATLASPVAITPRSERTSAPAGCLSVGSSAKYQTVQSAVNALSATSTTPQCIFIAKGIYKEQVYIKPLKSALTIYGETTQLESFARNTVTITQAKSIDDGVNDDGTATLRAWTPNLKVYNINLVNTRGRGAQALALSAAASNQGYYGCQFKGYQDTILTEDGNQVYAKCYIEGATDFIFGQRARAWFDRVHIGVLNATKGYITASGRDSDANPSYFVINNSVVTAATGYKVNPGAFYLGRPWGDYARVLFQSTNMTNVINPAGWVQWNANDPHTGHVDFEEFGNSGDGASGTRASFSKKLSAAVGISTILGNDYQSWVDMYYFR